MNLDIDQSDLINPPLESDYEQFDINISSQEEDDDDQSTLFHKMPDGWKSNTISFKIKHLLIYPFKSILTYFRRLIRVFGWKFISFLIVTQFLIKGSLYRLTKSGALPIFKTMGIDAVNLQLYATVISSPWAIKPLIGVLSDLFPIGGYHKRFWLVQSIIVGIVGGLFLVINQIDGIFLLIVSFTFINYEMSICDLLSEGKYSELMRKHPTSGSDIITFAQGCQILGSIVSMSFVGPLADNKSFRVIFFIAMIVSIAPIIPTLIGWLPEKKISLHDSGMKGNRCCMFDLSKFRSQKGLFAVVALAGIGGPVLASVTTFASKPIGLGISILMLIAMIIGAYYTFQEKVVVNIALYQVILRVFRPSISSAMDYFYTADNICLPEGPNFTFKYYITYTGILGSVVSFAAVWFYQIFMSKWKFRSVLILTLFMQCSGGLVDLIVVKRWNILWGIPDKTFYIMGEAILENVVSMLYWIPSSAILSKACGPGIEAATFAFLAGISNFAVMVSELSGAMIFEAAGIKTISPHCNFESLWWIIVICHITVPFLAGIPATWLIPDIRQTDRLFDEPECDFNSNESFDGRFQIEDDDEIYIGASTMNLRRRHKSEIDTQQSSEEAFEIDNRL